MSVAPLPYAPPIEPDETLWSWTTRVALYHGWSADEFLTVLGFGASGWENYFRQADVDCATPTELVDCLAEATGYSRELLVSHVATASTSTLWLDDRVSFCEVCWLENTVPYIRRAWLDAWCIDCPVHDCPLVTITEVRRPRFAADWNVAWSGRADWAERTCAPYSLGIGRDLPRREVRILRPLGAVERSAPITGSTSAAQGRPADRYERSLVLLSGKRFGEWSIVRAYFDVAERLQWRNVEKGFDSQRPLLDPLGSLNLRSGAIRIGRALFDILFDQSYREPRIADPLHTWMGGLFGRPRRWLMAELATLPTSVVERWKRKFEWTDEFEWLRAASSPRTSAMEGRPCALPPSQAALRPTP